MNYRHAFHAGNHADIFKHVILLFCLDALKRKPAPFAVLDTHAGAGSYDLFSAEAMRSPEWQEGVARIWDWPEAPPLVARLVEALRARNGDGVLRYYPGSPLLIADALREGDALDACELHPEDFATLRQTMRGALRTRLHERDGWEALVALTPPPQRRGLVLIDPPYEAPDELASVPRVLEPALKRFGHGIYLWWRPLKDERALAAADAEAQARGAVKTLRADFWVDTPKLEGRLVGSSCLLINPPFGLKAALEQTLPALAQRLSKGGGGYRVRGSGA